MTPALNMNEAQAAARDFGLRRGGQLEIPRNALPILALGSVAAPAFGIASQVELVSVAVTAGWVALFTGVLFAYDGAGFVNGSGSIIWTVDVNLPIGAAAGGGYPEKDLGAVKWPLGSYANGPWPVHLLHSNAETVRVKAYTVQDVSIGAPNFLSGGLFGFTWPARPSD